MNQEQITESVNAFLASGGIITKLPDEVAPKVSDVDLSGNNTCFSGQYEEWGMSIRSFDTNEDLDSEDLT